MLETYGSPFGPDIPPGPPESPAEKCASLDPRLTRWARNESSSRGRPRISNSSPLGSWRPSERRTHIRSWNILLPTGQERLHFHFYTRNPLDPEILRPMTHSPSNKRTTPDEATPSSGGYSASLIIQKPGFFEVVIVSPTILGHLPISDMPCCLRQLTDEVHVVGNEHKRP